MERAPFGSVSFGAVAEVVAENLAATTDPRGFHPGVEELRRRAAEVPDDDKVVWVEDGRVVAWAVVEPTFSNLLFGARPAAAHDCHDVLAFGRRRLRAGGAAYLAIVVVHPDHQGRGLARTLVAATVDRLREQGARTLASTTGAPALRHLLEDIGLATVATTHWWQGPLTDLPADV